jgi:hypothetical protein
VAEAERVDPFVRRTRSMASSAVSNKTRRASRRVAFGGPAELPLWPFFELVLREARDLS